MQRQSTKHLPPPPPKKKNAQLLFWDPPFLTKTVLSNSSDGLVAQGVRKWISLLDALFCLEPYRNTMSATADRSHVYVHDTPPSKAPGRRASRCQMLAWILYPGFGKMTCCTGTGGYHSWCSAMGGQPPCHLPWGWCCHRWAMHHCCCCALRLWGLNWTWRIWSGRICLDWRCSFSPSIIRFPTILLCTPVLNLVPIGLSFSTIDLCPGA